ncbi:hypothetical protein [Frigidibacter sp. SD6-1]|uniref:hypothetical protein n=1 Tax=Frigidibacter sp. SD6-1 TaxID=3032581 RepID=UPI0024E02C36|nr:hypothetical protein [Frigidibacter sp. SD6-1]
MSLIRPELAARLGRWSEALSALFIVLVGLWLLSYGGYVLAPLGFLILTLGGLWALVAIRRLAFLRPVAAPGMVEVDEGQVGYLGPNFGGYLALADLAEIRLTSFQGALHWRLRAATGEVLTIPVEAQGAERLHDAFATLPGLDMAALSAALARGVETLPLWRRPQSHL